MAGLTHEQAQELLEQAVAAGKAWPPMVQEHLDGCAGCRAHLALLQDLQLAVLEGVPAATPPPALRAQVLSAAHSQRRMDGQALVDGQAEGHRQSGRPLVTPAAPTSAARRWWPAALGAAAVFSGLLAFGTFLTRSSSVASALPDPAVVVNTSGGLVIASNDRHGTISVVQGQQVTASLKTGGPQSAWFTEGVRLGDKVFLADAANDRVLEVQAQPLKVLKTYRVPDGIAGLTASTGEGGGKVYFKGVRGEVGELGGPEITIAHEAGMPLADVMDGVLLAGGHLFVTHHLSGEVCLLDPQTLEVQKRVKTGGMPVALDHVRGGVLVLDVTGRLLRLNLAGKVVQQWNLAGHPDKLSVNGHVALVSDRAGTVTRLDLQNGGLQNLQVTHPMDVVSLPGGEFAVAEGGRGLRVLNTELNTTRSIEQKH